MFWCFVSWILSLCSKLWTLVSINLQTKIHLETAQKTTKRPQNWLKSVTRNFVNSKWLSHWFYYFIGCEAGQFVNQTGGCSPCPVGTYQSSSFHNYTECTNCTGIQSLDLYLPLTIAAFILKEMKIIIFSHLLGPAGTQCPWSRNDNPVWRFNNKFWLW